MADLPVYFAWGSGGQYIFVFPPARLVVVRQVRLGAPEPSDEPAGFPGIGGLVANLARSKMER